MAAGAGHLNAYAIGILVDLSRLERLRQKIATVTTAIHGLNASFRSKGVTTTIKNLEALTLAMQKLGAASTTSSTAVVSSQAKISSAVKLSGETAGLYSTAFTKYNKGVLGAASSTKNAFTDMFRRVALWSAGVGLLFGVISKIRVVFQGMKDLEESMTELKKVMDDDTPWKRAQNGIIDTAKTFSVAATEIAKITTIWAQQGKTLDEVQSLTKTAALGMNSANLTATQSVEFLTSATKAYNIEAESTERIIDGIMRVQSDFAITSASLAKGFNVAGALAAKAQVDMGGLFGMMTAIGEVTRETGNTIGNSLKTQFARLQNPKTIAYLQNMGIQMKEISSETGKIRRLSPSQVFKQISDKSKSGQIETDDVIDIALKIGGIRKFKDALILIERFGVAEEARAKFLLAYNDAARANDLVQENLTRKTEKLNTAFLDLGLALSDQGLYDGLKAIIDTTTGIINFAAAGAKSSTGERIIKLAGMSLLAKGILGLTKVILASSVKGTLKGAAGALGGGGVTPLQQAQLREVSLLQQRNISTLNLLSRSSKKTAAHLEQMAKSSGTSVKQVIKKLSIDAAGLGKEFHRGGNVFKNMIRSMRLSINGLVSGIKAQTSLSGVRAGGAAGVGAIGIGSRITSIVKGGAAMIAFMAAIEGATWLWEKYTDKVEEKEPVLRRTIDLESEATQGVLRLSSSYKVNIEAAKKLKISVDALVKSMTFEDRIGQAKEIGQILADGIRDETIKNVQDLKRVLTSLGVTDIKSLEQAQEIMIKFRNLFKYELAGGLTEGLTLLNKAIAEGMSEIEQTIITKGNVTFGVGFWQSLGAVATSFFTRGLVDIKTDILPQGEGAIPAIFTQAAKQMGDDFNKWVLKTSGRDAAPTDIRGFDLPFIPAMAGLIKELNKNTKQTELGTGLLKETFDNASITIAKGLLSFAGLAEETSGERAGAGGSEDLQVTDVEKVREQFKQAGKAARFLLEEQLELPAGTLETIDALGTILPNALGEWVDALYGGAFAMIKAEDRIWKATSNFVAKMEIIQIKERLAPALGLADTSSKDRLSAFREFFTKISTLEPSIQKTIRDIRNLQESLRTAIPDSAGVKFKSLLARFGDSLDDVDVSGKFLKAITQFEFGKEGDQELAERAAKEILRMTGSLVRAQAELGKLGEVGGDFNTKLQAMWTELAARASEFGLSLGDETKIKEIGVILSDTTGKVASDVIVEALQLVGKIMTDRIGAESDSIFNKALPRIASKLTSATNKLRTTFSKFAETGNRFVDAQLKLRTDLENILSTFQGRRGGLEFQRGKSLAEPEFQSRLDQITLEEQIAVAYAEANIAISDQLLLQKDVISATDGVKTSLVNMLSDVSTVTEFTGRSIGEAFTDIAGQRLEYQVQAVFDNAFSGIEGNIGATLLGIEKPELTPEQKAMIDSEEKGALATDGNTTALKNLTATMNALLRSTGGEVPDEILETYTPGAAELAELLALNMPSGADTKIETLTEEQIAVAKQASADMKTSLLNLGANLVGGLGGNALAGALGKESNRVNAGVGIGGALGGLEIFGPAGSAIGAIFGGLLGGLFGSDTEKEDVKPIKEDIRRIADNTAQLVAIDKVEGGGAVTYNITVNNTRGDAGDIAREVSRTLNSASTNFNRVNDTLA